MGDKCIITALIHACKVSQVEDCVKALDHLDFSSNKLALIISDYFSVTQPYNN